MQFRLRWKKTLGLDILGLCSKEVSKQISTIKSQRLKSVEGLKYIIYNCFFHPLVQNHSFKF